MTPAEFDWWFDRNPAGPRILNEARDDDGTPLGALAMSFARMSQGLAAFAVHAVTTPAARGRGVFSTLELQNEQEAAAAGATWALGFTNPLAGPILVGKLGWEDVTSLRIWARPKRLRRRGEGALRVDAGVRRFAERGADDGHHVVRDAAYLNWRYVDSPRPYVRVDDDEAGLVTHAVWHGFSSAVICEAVGGPRVLARRVRARRRRHRGCARQPRRGTRAFSRAGFVPTPRTIRFIGKRLTAEAPELPKRRDAWSFTLGDLDFF